MKFNDCMLHVRHTTPGCEDVLEDDGSIPFEGHGCYVEEAQGHNGTQQGSGAGHRGEDCVAQEGHVDVVTESHQPQGVGEHDTYDVLTGHH